MTAITWWRRTHPHRQPRMVIVQHDTDGRCGSASHRDGAGFVITSRSPRCWTRRATSRPNPRGRLFGERCCARFMTPYASRRDERPERRPPKRGRLPLRRPTFRHLILLRTPIRKPLVEKSYLDRWPQCSWRRERNLFELVVFSDFPEVFVRLRLVHELTRTRLTAAFGNFTHAS